MADAAERMARAMTEADLAKLAAALPKGWQPIETAPRDETEILGWSAEWRWVMYAICWFKNGRWCAATHIGSDPTHWMALPEPPA